MKTGNLFQNYRDEPALNIGAMVDFTEDNTTDSIKLKKK